MREALSLSCSKNSVKNAVYPGHAERIRSGAESTSSKEGRHMSTGVKTAIGKFVWHDNTSTDVDKAKTFYTDLFGWETELFKPGEMDYAMIKAGGQTHGGFGAAQGGAPSAWLG